MFDLVVAAVNETSAAFWVGHLAALELALAMYVRNQDGALRERIENALARIGTESDFESFKNETLARLIGLYLRAYLLLEDARYRDAAIKVIETARARFDEQDGYFKYDGADDSKEFYARANALLGEQFYFAWRVLDDPALRPIAGEMLGQLSAFFDPSPRFSDVEPAALVIDEGERLRFGVIAAAMQLFLTAGETTGRRSYLPRAAIVADAALARLGGMRGDEVETAELARALLRLEQFCGEVRYGSEARYLLSELDAPKGIEDASATLARMEAVSFPLHVVIVGDVENDAAAKELWLAALREYAPARVIEALHPTQHAARIRQLGHGVGDSAAAYVCAGTVCLPAVYTVDKMREGIRRARSLPTDLENG